MDALIAPPTDPAPARPAEHLPGRRVVPVAAATAAVALLVRLLALLVPGTTPNGDGAVQGLMALDLLHGRHLWLVWPGQSYAGTLDAALQAVSMGLFGVSTLALELPLALFTSLAIGVLAWTAGHCLRSPGAAAAVGLVLAVFPTTLALGGAVLGGGYNVSALLALSAVALALARPRLRAREAALLGLLCGLALWSQPLAVSMVAVAALLAVLRAGGLRRALVVAAAGAAGSLPAFALWAYGLHDGTDRTLSPLQDTLSLSSVLGPDAVSLRARALLEPVSRTLLGLEAQGVPAGVARALALAAAVALLVTAGVCAARRSGPLVPALVALVVLACAAFVTFPPAVAQVPDLDHEGALRSMPVARYVLPGAYAVGALAGLAVWALLRRPALLSRAAGVLLAGALVWPAVHVARTVHLSADPAAPPTLAQLSGWADDLEGRGVRCVVAGYWDVYPLVLASDGGLQGQSTFTNRLEGRCPAGPGTAAVFQRRPGGALTVEERTWAAAHPADRPVAGPHGVVAYLL